MHVWDLCDDRVKTVKHKFTHFDQWLRDASKGRERGRIILHMCSGSILMSFISTVSLKNAWLVNITLITLPKVIENSFVFIGTTAVWAQTKLKDQETCASGETAFSKNSFFLLLPPPHLKQMDFFSSCIQNRIIDGGCRGVMNEENRICGALGTLPFFTPAHAKGERFYSCWKMYWGTRVHQLGITGVDYLLFFILLWWAWK